MNILIFFLSNSINVLFLNLLFIFDSYIKCLCFQRILKIFIGLIIFLIYFNINFILFNLKKESIINKTDDENTDFLIQFQGSRLFCFTKDGINVYLELTFFYRLKAEKIKEMYLQFGDDWMESMARISVESIKESSIKFESKKYFTERNTINEELQKSLQASYDEKAEGAIEVGKQIFISNSK